MAKKKDDLRTEIRKAVVQSAVQHGEDVEPDMAIGDLEEALTVALRRVPDDQLLSLAKELRNSADDPGAFDTIVRREEGRQ